MTTQKKKLADLKRNEINVRKHSEAQIKEFVRSIEQFGVIRPIVIDENNVILCGHGLYEAMLRKGEESADCIVMSGLSEKQKRKLLLADNKIYTLGSDDYGMIDEIINSMDGDFDIPGYDSSILEEMYGISSIAEEDVKAINAPVEVVNNSAIPDTEDVKEPPRSVAEARAEYEQRAEQRKYVVCPNCGERIEI